MLQNLKKTEGYFLAVSALEYAEFTSWKKSMAKINLINIIEKDRYQKMLLSIPTEGQAVIPRRRVSSFG